MGRYLIDLATPADDADLRRVLAETPMAGRIAVSFRREPSYFAAAVVDGSFRQVVIARDGATGRIVGFGSRSVRELYVNGRPATVGYLSSLRLLAAHRNRGLVARGYAFFRKLHADGRALLYLTTIAQGNTIALATLTSGRAGLPTYHPAGNYHTAALPIRRRPSYTPAGEVLPGRTDWQSVRTDCQSVLQSNNQRSSVYLRSPCGVEVRPANAGDLPAVLAFLEAVGPERQFFPRYQAQDFFTPSGPLRDLQPADLLLAFCRGRLVGTLAGWDQHAFRQTVVHGYSPAVSWTRLLYNGWARLRGWPRLPAPGESFRYLTAALPIVADNRPDVLAVLLETLLAGAAAGPWEYLLMGLHETDPLLHVVRRYPATWYTTHLYLVCWPDGEKFRAALDGHPPYLELGSL